MAKNHSSFPRSVEIARFVDVTQSQANLVPILFGGGGPRDKRAWERSWSQATHRATSSVVLCHTWSLFFLLHRCVPGDVCCAQFTMDNKWYRARVVTAFSPAHPQVEPTLDNGLCVELVYIDYGNSEWLPLGR